MRAKRAEIFEDIGTLQLHKAHIRLGISLSSRSITGSLEMDILTSTSFLSISSILSYMFNIRRRSSEVFEFVCHKIQFREYN